MTTRRRFTAEFKARVALAALRGDRSIQEIATSILYQGALIMTHRDRAGDASGQGAGRGKPRAMPDIVKAFRRPHRFARCRFACATGTAVPQGFRAAYGFETGRMASE